MNKCVLLNIIYEYKGFGVRKQFEKLSPVLPEQDQQLKEASPIWEQLGLERRNSEWTSKVRGAREAFPASTPYMGICGRANSERQKNTPPVGWAKQVVPAKMSLFRHREVA